LRPPRGCASRPGSRARATRLRHLLTIWRGVLSRAAMTSLDRPSSERRMILARITSQYGDEYFRATDSSECRSLLERFTSNGLLRGIGNNCHPTRAYQITSPNQRLKYIIVFKKRSAKLGIARNPDLRLVHLSASAATETFLSTRAMQQGNVWNPHHCLPGRCSTACSAVESSRRALT